jgi:hypothetical protein
VKTTQAEETPAMKKAIGYGTLSVILATLLTAGAAASPSSPVAFGPAPGATPEKVEHGALHILLLYLPNRVLDILDVARLRARVGPGMAADVRVTKAGDLFLGTYASVYAGLPGPRNRPTVKLPVGLESRNGAAVSVVDASVDGGIGPDYGACEAGLGVQLLIVGVDAGVDPLELLDAVLGLLTIDLRGDDL